MIFVVTSNFGNVCYTDFGNDNTCDDDVCYDNTCVVIILIFPMPRLVIVALFFVMTMVTVIVVMMTVMIIITVEHAPHILLCLCHWHLDDNIKSNIFYCYNNCYKWC